MNDALTGETVELLQQLTRNQCVNDGTVASGQEARTSDVLRAYLEGGGLDIEVYEPDAAPGRTSLVARIEGTDPAAPTLCLMGHTDVVPVTPEHWTRDPFGSELVNGEVWGRGALDMLNLTASQAVALKALARRPGGWRPRGTLVYLACADEEAGGTRRGIAGPHDPSLARHLRAVPWALSRLEIARPREPSPGALRVPSYR
jgi:acetylornithine deacetylase/succinyl-diaminopimelate desuccinylase-like protein